MVNPISSLSIFLLLASLCTVFTQAKKPTHKASSSAKSLEIKFGFLPNPSHNRSNLIVISEEMPMNSLLGIVTVEESSKGNIHCEDDSNYIKLDRLGPKGFKVDLARHLDRELVEEFVVTVTCRDVDSVPPVSGTQSFSVLVLDENDNAPVFSETIYIANITENIAIGEVVLTVKATDADSDLSGSFNFSLFGLENYGNKPFVIDPETGRITTQLGVDRESNANFTFSVMATDKGKPANTGTAVVVVFIEDVNDNAPVVLNRELRTRENQAANTLVGKIIAADIDEGKNAELVFSKIEDDDFSSTAPFEVNPNGNVLSVVPLDREQRAEYSMKVMVKDRGTPRLSSTATIVIIVDDDNDNAPEITSDCMGGVDSFIQNESYLQENDTSTSDQGLISVDWYTPDNTSIYQVTATDRDSGDNSRLVFDMEASAKEEPSAEGLFAIDRSLGVITLRRKLLPSDGLVHLVNVSVSDSGNPSRSSYCLLNVTFDIELSLLETAASQSTEMMQLENGQTSHVFRTLPFRHHELAIVWLAALSLLATYLLK
ncbi:protocadherin Fat 4 [Biomphalaria pfeifferi]|uniref:Protocadherin Fat 4 n=1 Tax=Biomphalaria pfeifferi TaxID=112525 RepID=A0AAD8C1B2_BIOPF|nr:protocadherin Fat 4 [Biomphalaria pfeifferi]